MKRNAEATSCAARCLLVVPRCSLRWRHVALTTGHLLMQTIDKSRRRWLGYVASGKLHMTASNCVAVAEIFKTFLGTLLSQIRKISSGRFPFHLVFFPL